MQTILTKLSDEKAAKEVRQFAIAGAALSLVSLLIFWWLSIVGIALSTRGLLLTWHKANKSKNDTVKYRIISMVGVVIGLVVIAVSLSR